METELFVLIGILLQSVRQGRKTNLFLFIWEDAKIIQFFNCGRRNGNEMANKSVLMQSFGFC